MSLRKVLLAAAMLSLPVTAEAQQVRGIYTGGSLGVNWMEDSDVTARLGPRSGSGTASFHDGFVGIGSVGWGFGNGIRAELEANYRQNELAGLGMTNTGFGASSNTGRVFSWGLMVNGFYDFNLPGWPAQPYVGAGIGVVTQNWDNIRVVNRANAANYEHLVGTNSVFAYQLILGLAFPVESMPGLAFTAEYRTVGALDGDRDAYYYPGNGGPRIVGSADTTNGLNQSVTVGLRYNFGQRRAAPAPIPVVAPAPARTYLVFFDWDRQNLTDRARQIITEAAQASQTTQTTRIEVSGHADRSGAPQYNQRLSQRRADAVAAELERQGVPRSAMVIQAFGETRPLVPTADGVREPQNRRVEIVLN